MNTEITRESHPGLLAQARHYRHMLLKWRWTALLFFLVAVTAATVYSLLLTPTFTASGSVWIEDDPNILPFEEVQSFGPNTGLGSHTRLLQSRTLASDTINKLKLYDNPDFAGMPKKGDKPRDPGDPIFREELVQNFLENLTVASVERTRLVDVKFSNRNPRLAADILNALFDGYVDMIVRKRYSASEKASEFLNTMISEIRTEIEQREKELNQYGSEEDILPLTGAEAPTVTRISATSSALTTATLDRINKLNYYNQLKAAPLGEIPNAPEGSLIQRLREAYVTLNREYAARLATVKPEYPEMIKRKSDLDSATEALKDETQNLIRNAYNDYQAALRQEQSLRNLLNTQKDEAYRANSSSVIYSSLRIEVENQKTLLEALSKRKTETDISSRLRGLESLNVWIVDKADYPLRPAYPNKRKNVLMGFLFGLAGGIGLALGLEYLNQTVKTARDVSNSVSIPVLGSIPAFDSEMRPKGPIGEMAKIISMIRGKDEIREGKASKRMARSGGLWETNRTGEELAKNGERSERIELIAVREPQSIQAESYRSVRTNLLVSSPPGRIKAIFFTSPLAQEGKSSTISNLGITFAEAGKRVVIVDSDLRKPRQDRIFRVSSAAGPGLSRFLSSNIDPADIIKTTEIPNLQLIPSGPMPPNPIELLTSERMDSLVAHLKRNFDFVLFDTPPLLAVSDALAMGPMADAIILVVRGGKTPIPAIKQAKQKLDAHRLKCLGVIMNGVDLVEQEGYYAKQYFQYSKAE